MSFGLPKSGFQISAVSISSGKVKLVERCVDGNCDGFALRFPHGLLSGMEIFSDGLFNSIPEPHSFSEVETESIIRKWESDSSKRE